MFLSKTRIKLSFNSSSLKIGLSGRNVYSKKYATRAKKETKEPSLTKPEKKIEKHSLPKFVVECCDVLNEKDSISAFGEKIKETDQISLGAYWATDNTNFRFQKSDDVLQHDLPLLGLLFSIKNVQGVFVYFLPLGDDSLITEKWQLIKNIIEDKQLKKIAFNSQPIMRSIYLKLGDYFNPQNIYDPSVATWLLNSEWDSYTFSSCMRVVEKSVAREKKTNLAEIIDDFVECEALWEKLSVLLGEEKDLTRTMEMEMKISHILAKLEKNGVNVDPDCMKQYESLLKHSLVVINNDAEEILQHPINLSSPKEVGNAIYTELKLSPRFDHKMSLKQIKSSSRSTAEEVLTQIKHPFIRLLLAHRKITKYLSSFSLQNFAKQTEYKGHPIFRIFPHWIHQASPTGRISCREPNLQALRKEPVVIEDKENDSKTTITIRDSLTCKEGYVLLGADYSQIEFRMLAHLSKDQKLKTFFDTGQDIHSLVASDALGVKIENITPQDRNDFKEIVFGVLYGMGGKTLASKLNVSKFDADKFIRTFFEKFPSVKDFISSTNEYAHLHQKIQTISGRIRIMEPERTNKGTVDRRSINSIVQGSAADIIKLAMIKIDEILVQDKKKYQDCVLVLHIHDELVYEVPLEKLELMKVLVKESMENVYPLNVPLKVSMQKGFKWGSMQKIVE